MRENNQFEEFVINPGTLAIEPMKYGSKLYSCIYQLEDEIKSSLKPLDIIKLSCRLYGSSFEGRKDGCRQLTGITHKIPIIIDPINLMYFFPTTSPNNLECAWISHDHVLHYEKVDSLHTRVTFQNKLKIVFRISYYSFQTQMLRTALLRTKLMQRISTHSKASETSLIYGK